MLDSDVRLLSSTKLAIQAKFYGLQQRGKRGIYIVRKSVTDPRTHRERTFKRSTKTADLRLALYRAASWVDDFMGHVHAGRLPSLANATGWATLEQIAAHYRRAAGCSPVTRQKNLGRLEGMLEEMLPGQPFLSLSADVLDGRLVRQWQLKRKEEAERLLPNAEDCERAKRNANAVYRQARSVFSAAMLRSYEDAGLKLPPGAAEFVRQGFIAAAKAPPSEQLPAPVVSKILRLLPRLRQVRPGTWACLLLMFRGGLRNCEAKKARWSWILPTIGGGFVLQLHTQGDYKPKAADRIVALSPDVVELLRGVRRADDDHLVPAATDSERDLICYCGVNKFLHACGVRAIKGKVAYRLRGHAITEIILAAGMEAAREFAGHTSSRTTEIYRGAGVPYAPLAMPAG
jgi:hypothetical protein